MGNAGQPISQRILTIRANFLGLTHRELLSQKDFTLLDIPKDAVVLEDLPIPSKYKLNFDSKVMRQRFRKLPPYLLPNGEYFEGHWRMGKRCGMGVCLRTDGIILQGDWENDQFIQGRIIFQNGDIKMEDKYIFANGVIYVGDETYGKEIYPDGTVFEGDYLNGKKHGKGCFNFQDGSNYNGDFYENQFGGYGRFNFADGSMYEGQWLMGYMHGVGIMKHPDGREFQGEFRYGYKHGFGHMKYSDQTEFIGNYEQSLRQGKGKWIENSIPHDREFENGHMLEAAFKHSIEKQLLQTQTVAFENSL